MEFDAVLGEGGFVPPVDLIGSEDDRVKSAGLEAAAEKAHDLKIVGVGAGVNESDARAAAELSEEGVGERISGIGRERGVTEKD